MSFLHVLQQVLYIRVFFLTEAAVLLHLQMDSLYVDLEVSWAEAIERTVLTAELLSCVLPQVNIQVGFDG